MAEVGQMQQECATLHSLLASNHEVVSALGERSLEDLKAAVAAAEATRERASNEEVDELLARLQESDAHAEGLHGELEAVRQRAEAAEAELAAKAVEAEVSSVLSEVLGRVMAQGSGGGGADGAADAENGGGGGGQVRRLKEELMRVSAHARELAELQEETSSSRASAELHLALAQETLAEGIHTVGDSNPRLDRLSA